MTEEYWQLYIDYLTIVDTDVALLHFEWANAFWPGEFKSREDLVESVQARLTGGFYDVTL